MPQLDTEIPETVMKALRPDSENAENPISQIVDQILSEALEFESTDVAGTPVGLWAPEYARSLAVPGHHFHFFTKNRSLGGLVLDLKVDLSLQVESDLHI